MDGRLIRALGEMARQRGAHRETVSVVRKNAHEVTLLELTTSSRGMTYRAPVTPLPLPETMCQRVDFATEPDRVVPPATGVNAERRATARAIWQTQTARS